MTAASEVYEIVLEQTGYKRRWFRPNIAGAVILSVRRRDNGDEVFRHIEEADDDHLLNGIGTDLSTMTVDEFEERWL